MHTNRIKGLLHAQGGRDALPLKPGLSRSTRQDVRQRWTAATLKQEIVREHERLILVDKQLQLADFNEMAKLVIMAVLGELAAAR
jgi:transposase